MKKSLKNNISILLVFTIVSSFAVSCSISYKFNGSSIDYSKTKSISISDFPNVAELIFPPLSAAFSEGLRDVYSKNTRLQILKKGGDMHIEGEIVGYQLTPMAVTADSYASETKLTMSVKVRFTNYKSSIETPEKTYTAFQIFDSSRMLQDVQDELMKNMIDDITDQIYNDTVAQW